MIRALVFSLLVFSFTANAYWYFGARGMNGRDGTRGIDGRDGQSTTVQLDGSHNYLNLSGTDGTEGRDGSFGHSAYSCIQPHNARSSVKGARGGDAGDGGNGGRGGNGGDVTVYYDTLEDLNKLQVMSNAGRGGYSGRAGYHAGRGCYCQRHSWSIKRCHTDSDGDQVCRNYRYYCYNGDNGNIGRMGVRGRDGKAGKLTLINSTQPLPEVQSSRTLSLLDFADYGTVLSKHLWTTSHGALALLAPGSQLNDKFTMWDKTIHRGVELKWMEPRSIEDFANSSVTLYLDGTIVKAEVKGFWFDGSVLNSANGVSDFLITRAFKESDMGNFANGTVSGTGKELKVQVIDEHAISAPISTSFKVQMKKKRWIFGWKKIYKRATVANDFIRSDNGVYTLDLGQLPIKEKHLKSGKRLEVKVWATHSYQTHSKTKELTFDFVIQ